MTHSSSTHRTRSRELRDALGSFPTGVTVVTYEHDGLPLGITVSSFTSVSLSPALVLVNLQRDSRAAQNLDGRPFTINVLTADQLDVALQFSGGVNDDVVIEWDNTGIAPRLAETHAFYTCLPWATYDGGDHIILVGEVIDFDSDPSQEPLVFHQSRFKELL